MHSRFIAHNIMVCQDLAKGYERKNVAARCLIKLDLQKAYNIVEWDFVEEMLEYLQFPRHFISLIMSYVRSPRLSLAINGILHGLLFVLCVEYLCRILNVVGEKEGFTP